MSIFKKPIHNACASGIEPGEFKHSLGRFYAPELLMKAFRRHPVNVFGVTTEPNAPARFSDAVDEISESHIAVWPWLTYRRAYVFHTAHVSGDPCATLFGYSEPEFLEARGDAGFNFLEHGRVWARLIIEPVVARDFRDYVRGLADPVDELDEAGAFIAHLRELADRNELAHEINCHITERAEFARKFPEYPNASRLVFDEYALIKKAGRHS